MAIRAAGAVERLYVRGDLPPSTEPGEPDPGPGVFIRLDIPPERAPLSGYFKLKVDHPNYFALYSLALTAAINRLPLSIRTDEEITPDAVGIVNYMVIDW